MFLPHWLGLHHVPMSTPAVPDSARGEGRTDAMQAWSRKGVGNRC